MKTFILPFMFLLCFSFLGSAENQSIDAFGCNGTDCDQVAMDAYNSALNSGESSHYASGQYAAALEGCIEAGGCSEQILDLEA